MITFQIILGFLFLSVAKSKGQCIGGFETYERTIGMTVDFKGSPKGLVCQAGSAITRTSDCTDVCLQTSSCKSFTLDFSKSCCDWHETVSRDGLKEEPKSNYFERTCYQEVPNFRKFCKERLWAFDRVVGAYLEGFDDKERKSVHSRIDCQRHCLLETDFICRSAEYDATQKLCRWSREDRRTRPNAFRHQRGISVEYLENQCVENEKCEYSTKKDTFVAHQNDLRFAKNIEECQALCDSAPDFNCRSLSFSKEEGHCALSSDDSLSLNNASLPFKKGSIYSEKNCRQEARTGKKMTDRQFERCAFGQMTFEKVSGFELLEAHGTKGTYPLIRNLFAAEGLPGKCARLCRSDINCHAFNVDYDRKHCTALEFSVFDKDVNLQIGRFPRGSFFQGICLRGGGCGLRWTFERMPNFYLKGFDQEVVGNVGKRECQDLCLQERRFICRSAAYDYLRRECRLSTEDRFSQPRNFVSLKGTDYFENQCASQPTKCGYTIPKNDRYLAHVDRTEIMTSERSCQKACDDEKEFNCRSYSFLNQQSCLLSSDMASALPPEALEAHPRAIYSEKECQSKINYANPYDPRPYPTTSRDPYETQNQNYFNSNNNRYPISSRDPYYENNYNHYHQNNYNYEQHYHQNYPNGRNPYEVSENSPIRCRYTTTYEKIVGHTHNAARKQIIQTRSDFGIIGECLRECDSLRDRCLAVSLEPGRGSERRCFSLDRSSESDSSSSLQSSQEFTHFEKICLKERGCGKLWTFTRYPGSELGGPGDLEIRNIRSLRECQDECLRGPRGPCRSVTYYHREQLCKLSSETRRTRPENFKKVGNAVDYMENECAPNPPHCDYTDSPGKYFPLVDKLIPRIYSHEDCRRSCDSEPEFQCRSFSFNAHRRECLLSSDDSTSSGIALIPEPAFFNGERGSCNNVKVDCTPSDILVTLNFGHPFAGRVFATGNPQSCFEMGGDRTQIILRISLGTQCGTNREGQGRYVNHVVIQQNPVVMLESDKTLRVECSFDAQEQKVAYNPEGEFGSKNPDGSGITVTVPFEPKGTNVIKNTAPPPNVRMKIVKRNGQDASVVGLGEELQLRIEVDPSSAFGILARNVEARNEYGEIITLIDNNGCPRDPNVFSAMEIERRSRNLFANFKAFRFPSTATVSFVATIQFCQDVCEPAHCQGGLYSFGRRKRSMDDRMTEGNSTKFEDPKLSLPSALPLRSKLVVMAEQEAHLKNNDNEFLQSMNKSYQHSDVENVEIESSIEGYICSTKGTVVGSILASILLQLGFIAGLWMFYRSKQRQYADYLEYPDSLASSNFATDSPKSPEELFRKAYDTVAAGGRRILYPYKDSKDTRDAQNFRTKSTRSKEYLINI